MSAIQGNNQYTHVNGLTAGTQIGPTGSIRLHAVSVNTKGATSNLLTIYDGVSTAGTVVAVIDTTAQPVTLVFDVSLLVGLFIVLAAGTAADLTFAWTPGN
jgi:hypothetical protein